MTYLTTGLACSCRSGTQVRLERTQRKYTSIPALTSADHAQQHLPQCQYGLAQVEIVLWVRHTLAPLVHQPRGLDWCGGRGRATSCCNHCETDIWGQQTVQLGYNLSIPRLAGSAKIKHVVHILCDALQTGQDM